MKVYFTLLIAVISNSPLFAQAPVITNFTPISGTVGTAVTITGSNFNTTPNNNIVFFGAVKAAVTAASTSSLTVTVPSGATYQPITVTTNSLVASSAKPFTVTFTGAGAAFTSSSFAQKKDYASGLGTACMVSGDLDGDGKADLIASNANANTISIFRNLSTDTISLSPKTDFATGSRPFCVTVGDLDGDGKLDIAVSNGLSNNISIFMNTSNGPGIISFAARIDLTAGLSPSSVVIGDIDLDGKPELLVSNYSSSNISIFKNISTPGNFSFLPKVDLATGASPNWLTIADLDNDGKPDLATANGIAINTVSVLKNTSIAGNISFAGKTDFDASYTAYSIAFGDIDGDGKPDLITTGEAQSPLVIRLNSTLSAGNISFGPKAQSFYSGAGSYGVSLSDLDGDAKPDIVIPNSTSSSISVLKNKSIPGTLSFDPTINYSVGTNPWVSSLVDLDGDGKTDIISANYQAANVSVLKNTSDLGIQSFSPTSAGKGITVTISGSGFNEITGVSFGGVPAASITINSPTSISAVVGSGASGNIVVSRNGVKATLPGFTFLPLPVITSFTPGTAGSGDTVIVEGTNFANIINVNFGGVPASSTTYVSSTKIIAVVGTGASGNLSYSSTAGIVTSAGFVYDNIPLFTSFFPNNVPAGAMVSIIGKHFTGTNSVKFGGIAAASFVVVSPNLITAVVGAGGSGNIEIVNSEGAANIAGFNFIPPPVIVSVIPLAAGPLEVVTILGNNLNNVLSVEFGGVPASSYHINSSNSISATVAGGSSGIIEIKTIGGNDSMPGFKYLSFPIPVINSFSPNSGHVGTTVTIAGLNFSSIKADNTVYFGAVKADVLSSSETLLTVKVPAGASYSPISVTTEKNLTAYTVHPFTITFDENVTNFSSNTFAPKLDFVTGTYPKYIELSDLDGDNKTDMIIVNGVSNSLSVIKNISSNNSIMFDQKFDINVKNAPSKVTVGDFDGDGKNDLIGTIFNDGGASYISIHRNTSLNGTISFATQPDLATGNGSYGTDIGDFDGDGRPDIAVTSSNSATFSIFRNISTKGNIAFDKKVDFYFYRGDCLAIRDLDGDNKPEIVITNPVSRTIAVYRNTSTIENISFAEKVDFNVGNYPVRLSLVDFNGDNKTDIALVDYIDNSLLILKNISTTGTISFASPLSLITNATPSDISVSDLDGDSRPDLVVGNYVLGSISVFKNTSSIDQIAFAEKIDYITGNYDTYSKIADLDGDGRPDIAVVNSILNTVSILKNKIGDLYAIKLCPPIATSSIPSDITGTNYQWQVSINRSDFINISDNNFFSGTNTPVLQIIDIPSASNGQRFQCIANAKNSAIFELQFTDSWTGAVSSFWENPANWVCNALPDSNTDVIINSGTIVISSDVTVRSLTIKPGANLTVNPGVKLIILH